MAGPSYVEVDIAAVKLNISSIDSFIGLAKQISVTPPVGVGNFWYVSGNSSRGIAPNRTLQPGSVELNATLTGANGLCTANALAGLLDELIDKTLKTIIVQLDMVIGDTTVSRNITMTDAKIVRIGFSGGTSVSGTFGIMSADMSISTP
jgi:hypothetical protein